MNGRKEPGYTSCTHGGMRIEDCPRSICRKMVAGVRESPHVRQGQERAKEQGVREMADDLIVCRVDTELLIETLILRMEHMPEEEVRKRFTVRQAHALRGVADSIDTAINHGLLLSDRAKAGTVKPVLTN